MARERLITRNISGFDYECLVINPITQETSKGNFVLTGFRLDDKKALKEIQERYSKHNAVPVFILGCTETVTRYGMPETEFIKYARILPPLEKTSENDEAEA